MLLWILLALLAGPPPGGVAERLREVRALIQRQGAAHALGTLYNDDQRWDRLLDDIATGDASWLRVAADLRAVSDADASETLAMAIQEALPRNTPGVLELVANHRVSVANACGMYGFGQIEDERPLTQILGLVDKRTKLVARVTKPSLASARDACLNELRRLRKALQKQAPDSRQTQRAKPPQGAERRR